MRAKGKFALAGCFALAAAILAALVRRVDVAAIGPEGTEIGLSRLNGAVHEFFGVNMFWYTVTEGLGVLAIFVALLFAGMGLMQLVRRRSFAKVDREIYALGGLYVAVAALYAAFEKVVVNYRPVLMPGSAAPEASFPSSHTMLACVVLGSAMMVLRRYVRSGETRAALRVLGALLIAVTVGGRLVSGVHWCTDILGGVLISAALLALFSSALDVPDGAGR